MEKLKKGFASLGKDNRVAAFSDELSKDVDHLSLFLITQGLSSNSKPTNKETTHLKGRQIFEVPRRRVTKFIGQEQTLQKVTNAIEIDPHIVVLQGMGGVGKTQISLEFCRRARESQRFQGIFWVNASSDSSVKEGFESLSETLKSSDEVLIDADSRVRYVKRILTDWPEPWLLVLDNFDDPSSFPIRDYMSAGANGHFLITSRSMEAQRLGHPIVVASMSEDEALALCLSTSGIENTGENLEHCSKIIQRLGHLPLAIDLAGSYIRERASVMKPGQFLTRYDAQAEAILKITPGISEYAEDHRGIECNVFATYELTLQLLESNQNEGNKKIDFFNVIGFFSNDHLCEDLFRAYYQANTPEAIHDAPWLSIFLDSGGKWDALKFEDLIVRATNLNLVQSQSRDSEDRLHFSVHPLISEWLRIRQLEKDRKLGASNYHLSASILSVSLMKSYTEFLLQPAFNFSFQQHNAFIAHFIAREGWTDFYKDQKPTMLGGNKASKIPCVELRFAIFLYDSGFSPTSLRICQKVWREMSTHTAAQQVVKRAAGAYMWHNLCTIHRHTEAHDNARDVANFWSEKLGPSHPFTLEALHYLACSLSWVGANGESEEVLRDVLSKVSDFEEWDEICAENVWLPRPVWSLAELAYSLSRQRSASKKQEADEIMAEVMSIRETNEEAQHGSSDWAWRHYSLAISLAETPAVKSSLAWELLARIENAWGQKHSNYFLAQVEVIGALLDREDKASAEKMTKFLLHGLQNTTHATGYRYLFWGLTRLSAMFLNQGKLSDAEDILRQMLDLNKDMPDSIHASDFVLKDLGACLFKQGKYSEADVCMKSRKDQDLASLIQHSLIKHSLGTTESLREANELLEKALQCFIIKTEKVSKAQDPATFSLEMIIMRPESETTPKYKLEVHGCLSCEVLILKALTEIRLGNPEASGPLISAGIEDFDATSERAELATDFCQFIHRQVQVLLDAAKSPESYPINSLGSKRITTLVDWAIRQCSTFVNVDKRLLDQLKKQLLEIQEVAKEVDKTASTDDLSKATSASSEASRKNKRSRMPSIFANRSSKSGSIPRMNSYSSQAATLVPQRTISSTSTGAETTEEKFGSLSIAEEKA